MAKKNHYHIVLQKEDIDSGLKEHMDALAAQKKLTARVKTALTLLAQLEVGNTEMLDSMFPAIAKKNTPPPQTSGDLQRIISDAVRTSVAEEMQKLPALPAGRMVAEPAYKESGAGIGTIGQGRKIELPVFDENEDDGSDTVVINIAADSDNADNGLAAMLKIAF